MIENSCDSCKNFRKAEKQPRSYGATYDKWFCEKFHAKGYLDGLIIMKGTVVPICENYTPKTKRSKE